MNDSYDSRRSSLFVLFACPRCDIAEGWYAPSVFRCGFTQPVLNRISNWILSWPGFRGDYAILRNLKCPPMKLPWRIIRLASLPSSLTDSLKVGVNLPSLCFAVDGTRTRMGRVLFARNRALHTQLESRQLIFRCRRRYQRSFRNHGETTAHGISSLSTL